jgi:aspartyl-tRNA(Asn)/glutamyl-tRNA(Gln) amidotransferase subunit A
MAGPDERDPTSLAGAPEPYSDRLEAGIRGLRVAYSPDFGYLRVDPEVAEPVRAAVAAFAEQGAIVEEVTPGWDDPIEMERCFWAATFAGNQGVYLDRWADRMDPALVACIEEGLALRAVDLVRAKQQRLDLADRVQALFDRYDLLVSPTVSVAAFPSGRIIPAHWDQHPWDGLRWAGFTYPFNLTGLPAASCPCGFTADGRPVGLQIVAGRFRDLLVLQASRAFEQARPWAQCRPTLAFDRGA